jgi:hypothetical protein
MKKSTERATNASTDESIIYCQEKIEDYKMQ